MRSVINRSFTRDDEVNTSIYYTKDIVDDLKKEIDVLQNRLQTVSTEMNECSDRSIDYMILEKKYQDSLRKIEYLEKSVLTRDSFRPNTEDPIQQLEREIDSLKEKIRLYENQEIPLLKKKVEGYERMLIEKELNIPDDKEGLGNETSYLENRIKELEEQDNDNKAKLAETMRVMQNVQKVAEVNNL